MRSVPVLACAWVTLACASAFLACAASGDETTPVRQPESDGGESVIPDGGAPERDAEIEVAAEESRCSDAGWCVTALPDPDLVLRDIWPIGGRAFAIAESPTLGVKVLEWNEAEQAWGYIDDGSQHEFTSVAYVGKIWAPTEDEVYYGVAPGYIFHGTRPVAPATAWSWTRHKLEDHSHPDRGVNPEDGYPIGVLASEHSPALGVWGTSANDVYAWFTNSIYHWKSADGGAPSWVLEYVADDPAAPDGPHASNEHLYFTGVSGTSPDDVWFSGARARSTNGCALIVRRTAAEYRRIADGVLSTQTKSCTERAGTVLLGTKGWLADIQALAPGELIGLRGGLEAIRMEVDGDGYSVDVSNPYPSLKLSGRLTSLWGNGRSVWLSGLAAGGVGFVLRGSDVWTGGSYELSRVTRPRGPVDRPLYKIRGTSNSNLWAIGEGYALHKTTP